MVWMVGHCDKRLTIPLVVVVALDKTVNRDVSPRHRLARDTARRIARGAGERDASGEIPDIGARSQVKHMVPKEAGVTASLNPCELIEIGTLKAAERGVRFPLGGGPL